MNIYKRFAYFYTKGRYPEFSEKMAKLIPPILNQYKLAPVTILDIACGEGTFAIEIAKMGFQVTGIDLSQDMLRFAKVKAKKANVNVKFVQKDMRKLNYSEKFELVTCWYDSLNYLIKKEALEKTFSGVSQALKKGGLFIFDMNTIYGLTVHWQRYPCYIQQNTTELFEIHIPSYDFEKNTATLTIRGFIKEGKKWELIEEVHKERGYTLEEIRECLMKSNLRELKCWGNLENKSEPEKDTSRVWFVAKKRIKE